MNDIIYTPLPPDIASDDWDDIAAQSPDFNLLQSWSYGEARTRGSSWRLERAGLWRGGQRVAMAQVLIRVLPLGLGGLAWLNRGPIRLAGGEASELEVMAALAGEYTHRRGLYFRAAPPFDAGWAAPGQLETAGLHETEIQGWASGKLDLSRSLDDLRAGLHAKWRNALKRAEGDDIAVESGASRKTFEAYLESYRAHLEARGPDGGLSEAFLRNLNDALAETAKLTVFLARVNGEVAGGVLIVRYGSICEYLSGFNAGIGRKKNVGQLLLWSAISAMKSGGVMIFDLGGMDFARTPEGILRFKQRTGADAYQHAPEAESRPRGLIARAVRHYVGQRRF